MPLRFLIILILPLLFTLGCNNESSPKTNLKTEQLSSKQRQDDPISNRQIAKHLTELASNVPGVDQAVALVAGPYAIVGIDLEEQLDSSRVGTIKYSVTEALRSDPYGKTAIVVADPDILERIEVLREKVGQGQPSQAIFDEIASLVARIIPLTPKEDQPLEQERNMEIDDDENRELDKIQRRQSRENNEG